MYLHDMRLIERVDLLSKLQREYICMTKEQQESAYGSDLHARMMHLNESIKCSEREIPMRYDMVDMSHYLDCLRKNNKRSRIASFFVCVCTFSKLIINRVFCKTE